VQEPFRQYGKLIRRKNVKTKNGNGVYDRYASPVLTAEHTPLLCTTISITRAPASERIGVNAAFNAGAMEYLRPPTRARSIRE
jgi:4-O-beta-D-mannosyl-D-glucose phosphorylase